MLDMNSELTARKTIRLESSEQRTSQHSDNGLEIYQLGYRLLKERPLVTIELVSLKTVRARHGTDSSRYEREVLAL